jgi:transcriptional regulator with XRE-family HTH domain
MEKLKELRKAAGFKTQQEFAEATGLSQSFISEVEAGRKKPGFKNLKLMAKALGVTVDELVADPEQEGERCGYQRGAIEQN